MNEGCSAESDLVSLDDVGAQEVGAQEVGAQDVGALRDSFNCKAELLFHSIDIDKDGVIDIAEVQYLTANAEFAKVLSSAGVAVAEVVW